MDAYDPDNPTPELFHYCKTHAKRVINPIIDWTTDEVWEFIEAYELPYCELYDQGYTRLGCIGCPISYRQREELERYPKFKQAYLRAFEKMIKNIESHETKFESAEQVMEWWLNG